LEPERSSAAADGPTAKSRHQDAENQPREVRASAGLALLAVASYKLPEADLWMMLADKA
jgi:hypothetical protein